jgi:hypothetical protein
MLALDKMGMAAINAFFISKFECIEKSCKLRHSLIKRLLCMQQSQKQFPTLPTGHLDLDLSLGFEFFLYSGYFSSFSYSIFTSFR